MLALAERERARAEQARAAREIEARVATGRLEWRDRLASAGGGGGVEMTAVRMQAGATLRDLAALKRAALSLAAAEREAARARGSLLEATKRRRAIEDLRERALAAWKSERARLEQRTIDELVVTRFGRGDTEFGDRTEGAW